jgi:hypothetical protein
MLLLSTAYFPPIEYFVLLMHHQRVTIDLHETYPKQTWRNRCVIASGNGPVTLSVPVQKPQGNHTKTIDVLISDHYPWRQNHWRSIHSAYRNAPYFIYYADLVENLILRDSSGLIAELNRNILNSVAEELGINTVVEYSPSFVKKPSDIHDLRYSLSPKARDRQNIKELVYPKYYQVFEERWGFLPNTSILDLIFNLGPDATNYLKSIQSQLQC